MMFRKNSHADSGPHYLKRENIIIIYIHVGTLKHLQLDGLIVCLMMGSRGRLRRKGFNL